MTARLGNLEFPDISMDELFYLIERFAWANETNRISNQVGLRQEPWHEVLPQLEVLPVESQAVQENHVESGAAAQQDDSGQ